MPYVLGIDIGSSVTAAALCRLGGDPAGHREPPAEPVVLERRSATVPTVLYLPGDGSVLVGEDARQRGRVDHRRVARGFVDRVGDDVPVLVGGEPYLAHDLAAALVSWVVDQVAELEDQAPEHVVVTHRAGWGGYRQGLLLDALREFGITDVTVLPTAIAASEGQLANQPVPAGGMLAVLDLGVGAFEAAVVRRTRAGTFELLGRADSAEALDGVAVDPGGRTDVTTATLETTVDALLHVLRCRGVDAGRLLSTVLAGASARLPAAEQLVAARLPGPVTVQPDPELTVATGAALTARRLVSGVSPPGPMLADAAGTAAVARPAGAGLDMDGGALGQLDGQLDDVDDEFGEPPPRPPVRISPPQLPQPRTVGRLVPGVPPRVLGAAATVLAIASVVLTVALQSGEPGGGSPVPDQLNPGRGGGGPAVSTQPAQPGQFTNPADDPDAVGGRETGNADGTSGTEREDGR